MHGMKKLAVVVKGVKRWGKRSAETGMVCFVNRERYAVTRETRLFSKRLEFAQRRGQGEAGEVQTVLVPAWLWRCAGFAFRRGGALTQGVALGCDRPHLWC